MSNEAFIYVLDCEIKDQSIEHGHILLMLGMLFPAEFVDTNGVCAIRGGYKNRSLIMSKHRLCYRGACQHRLGFLAPRCQLFQQMLNCTKTFRQ